MSDSTRPTIASAFLSSLLTRNETPVAFLPIGSTIDNQRLSYTSTLVSTIGNNITFLSPPEKAAQSHFNITDALLVNYGQRAVSMGITFTSRVIIPFNIQQQLLGFSIESMDIRTANGTLAAVMRRRVIADSTIEQRNDGTTLFRVIDMDFGLYNATAFNLAVSGHTQGVPNQLQLKGIAIAQVATQAGLVEVGQLRLEGQVSAGKVVNATGSL